MTDEAALPRPTPEDAAEIVGISVEDLDHYRFSPGEAAAILKINTNVLAQMRRNGKITGNERKNTTEYSWDQLCNANLVKDKPGRRAGNVRGREKRTLDTGSSSVASVRYRVPNRQLLVVVG